MGARTRSRVRTSWVGGRYTVTPSTVTLGYSGTSDHETNSDVTMAKPYVVDHPLVITRKANVPLRYNGTIPYNPSVPAGAQYVFEDYNPANRTSVVYSPTLGVYSAAYWKTKALANLDPWSPKVDLPLFIWELKDLPKMVKGAGDFLLGRSKSLDDPGGLYLAYKFGLEALVRDVLGMFEFTQAAEERKAHLRALEHGTFLKRSLFKRSETESTVQSNAYGLTLAYRTAYRADIHMTTTEKHWFTCNAKLVDPLPSGGALQTLSEDIVRGLTLRPASFWDYIPFTWLSDYFVNIGDYLEAYQTMTRLQVTRMNVMATRKRTSVLVPTYVEAGLTASYSELSTTEKRRTVYSNPTPSLSFTPFLTGGQVAILGALAATRSKRAVRLAS